MSGWTARRFWTSAQVRATEDGFLVELDGRPVRTPAKRALLVPSRALAEAVAAEWDAQGDEIRPDQMPLTRSANSALDKIAPQRDVIVSMIADYGGTDLLCYRASTPAELVSRQAAAWDPWLAWSAAELDAPLNTVQGVMHMAQPPASLVALRSLVDLEGPFQLAALHDLVVISGSLILGLAVRRGAIPTPKAWELSRIDEAWQQQQWGEDAEAMEAAACRMADFERAVQFLRLLEETHR